MATYNTDKVVPNSAGTNTVEPKWLATGRTTVIATCTLASGTSLAINDTIQIADIPAGARIVDFALDSDKVDSSGSPTLTLNVGDGTTAAKYFSASNVGQAGGVARMSISGNMGASYASTTRVLATVAAATAAATSAARQIRFVIDYAVDP